MSNDLITRQRRFAACKEDIFNSISTFGNAMDVFQSAMTIVRDEELYKLDGLESFDEFSLKIKEDSLRHTNNKLAHQVVILNLEQENKRLGKVDPEEFKESVSKIAESATRSIRTLKPEQQAEVIEEASKSGKTPTVKDIKDAQKVVAEKKPKKEPAVAKANADMPEFYVDSDGHEVPESLFEVWREGAKIQGIVNGLKTCLFELSKLNETELSSRSLDSGISHVENAIAHIEKSAPAVLDSDSGWLTKGEM